MKTKKRGKKIGIILLVILIFLIVFFIIIGFILPWTVCWDGVKYENVSIKATYFENGTYEISGDGILKTDVHKGKLSVYPGQSVSYEPPGEFCELYKKQKDYSFGELVSILSNSFGNYYEINNNTYPYNISFNFQIHYGIGGCGPGAMKKMEDASYYVDEPCLMWDINELVKNNDYDTALERCGSIDYCLFALSILTWKKNPEISYNICNKIKKTSGYSIECKREIAHIILNKNLALSAKLCKEADCNCIRLNRDWKGSNEDIKDLCFYNYKDDYSWICRCFGNKLINEEDIGNFSKQNLKQATIFCNLQSTSYKDKCLSLIG